MSVNLWGKMKGIPASRGKTTRPQAWLKKLKKKVPALGQEKSFELLNTGAGGGNFSSKT